MGFTAEQKEEIMNLYSDLRLCDVRDGMDWVGYHHYGSMSPNMRPIFRTKVIGFANTSRYIPYDKPAPAVTGKEYSEWAAWYYEKIAINPWCYEGFVQKYDMFVVDQGNTDFPLFGSFYPMIGLMRGGVGFVINGAVRDTDEIIMQKTPMWSTKIGQPMDQARMQFENYNCKINCDGVCVNPGDLVVADGDGVLVVPQEIVYDTAKYAHHEKGNDMRNRKYLYMKLNIEPDESVSDAMDLEAEKELIDTIK